MTPYSHPASLKRRIARAKRRTERILKETHSCVYRIESKDFHLIAVNRRSQIVLVRVEVDKVTGCVPKIPSCVSDAQLWVFSRGSRDPRVINVKM